MCGRYRLTAKERYLRDHFGLDVGVKWLPRWNIAPTQLIPTIRQHPKEPIRYFQPHALGTDSVLGQGPSIGLKTINAMSETAAVKPVFRDAFKHRRCLIPADGFYEWKKIGPKQKQAYNFGTLEGSVFDFAGVWDRWRQPDNTMLETCAILTTPAILNEEDYERWLDPGITDPKRVEDCLRSFDSKLMKKYPVSSRVNRPENDDETCAVKIPPDNSPMNLFDPSSNA
jgi:putative SOS response-associated peptidase YedK